MGHSVPQITSEPGGRCKSHLGAVSIRKTVLLCMVIPMLKIRRPTGRLIFNMGISIPGKTVFYIETGPRSYWVTVTGVKWLNNSYGHQGCMYPIRNGVNLSNLPANSTEYIYHFWYSCKWANNCSSNISVSHIETKNEKKKRPLPFVVSHWLHPHWPMCWGVTTATSAIVPFQNDFSPSGEQHEQCKLTHTL